MAARCPWWVRWYHRRQRTMDRQGVFDPMFEAQGAEVTKGAFELHLTLPTGACWICGCGQAPADTYLAYLNFHRRLQAPRTPPTPFRRPHAI